MASKRIKGITIEIGGETTGLQKALSDVNKKSSDLKSELRDVERLLKFDPGNAEAVAQKQKLLAEQVENTASKLKQLKDAEKQVQDQVKRGDISEKQYRDFRREIEFTEAELKNMKDQLGKVNDGAPLKSLEVDARKATGSVKDLGGEIAGVVGALAAGGGLAGAVSQALDVSSLNTKIDITFDVPEKSKKSVKEAVRDIEAYGLDAEEALEGVRRQWALNADASDEANAKIVKDAGTIAAAYSGIDFTELIQETNEISRELGITNEEALGLTNSLLKIGFPPEQLDIVAEYGKQLTDAGYNAQEVQAIMAAGVETGTWNIDNLLDGIKEGRIRLVEFGDEVPKATKDLLKNTEISAKQMKEWGESVAKGGEGGKKAMQEVAQALQGVEDDTTRNALGVQVFGTMWEDQGTNITDTILNMDDHLMSAKENQDQLNTAVSNMDASPAVQMQQAIGDLKAALEPVLEVIADVISKIAEWVANNPTLAATLTAVATAIGILIGIAAALAPIFMAISTAAAAAGVSMGAIAAPVLIAIAAIAAIIAIGVLLWKNWDTIKKKAAELAGKVKEKFHELKEAISQKLTEAKKKLTQLWSNMASTTRTKIEELKNAVRQKFEQVKSAISDKLTSAKNKASEIFSNIKSSITGKVSDIVSSVRSKFEQVKNNIMNPIRKAREFVGQQIEKIKGFFSGLKLSLPKIKLPHFSLSGDFSLKPPRVPKLSVDWYKTGGLFNGPSVIGVGEQPGVNEAVIPLSGQYMKPFAQEIARQMGGSGTTVNVYPQKAIIDQRDIAREFRRMEVLYGR